MLLSSRNYAIGMAHFQISGGWRILLVLVGAYLAVAASIIALAVYNTDPADLPMVLRGVATLFLVMEAFGLVVLGSVRVAGCIRMDVQSNMIESHRQMPVAAWRAMIGYLVGSTAGILAVWAVNLAVLAGMLSHTGMPPGDFVLGQIVLAGFAVFAWTLSAMGALMFRQAMALIVLIFVFGSCGSMALRNFGILPGASLLAAPFLGETIFVIARGTANVRQAYPVSLAAQGAFALLFFIGACRRYRGTYLTTFNVPMGIALVAIWTGLSAVAIRMWPELGNFRALLKAEAPDQMTAAFATAALLAIVPLHALATWETRFRVRPLWRTATLGGTLLATLILLAGDRFDMAHAGLALLVMTAHVATMYAALRLCATIKPTTALAWMLVLLFVLWAVPVLIEVVRWFFLPQNRGRFSAADFTVISTFSPLGLLRAGWRTERQGPPLLPGICYQLAVAVTMCGVAWWRGRNAAATEAAAPETA